MSRKNKSVINHTSAIKARLSPLVSNHPLHSTTSSSSTIDHIQCNSLSLMQTLYSSKNRMQHLLHVPVTVVSDESHSEYRPYPQTEGQGLIKGGIAFQPPQDRSTVAVCPLVVNLQRLTAIFQENAGPVPMKVHKQRLDTFLPPWTGTATTSEEPMKRNKKTRITTPKVTRPA